MGRREPQVSADEVEAELERLRESLASLETVEREAGDGDFLVVDFLGTVDGEAFEGGEARGYLLELGSGRLVEGFEEQLRGARAGDEREVRVTFPDDYREQSLAGRDAVFAVTVKEVKEKRLPELDDDFAVEAGGFDTLDELRGEIESRLREVDERAIEREFREAAVDAAAREAKIDVPHELVHAKAHEMWHRTARRLAGQGIDPPSTSQLTGKDEEELVTEAEPRRGAGAAARVGARGDRGGRGHRGLGRRDQGRPARGGVASGGGSRARRRSTARSSAPAAGRRRGPARGHRDAQGRGPDRRARQADPRRAGPGARQAVDAGEGSRAEDLQLWTPGS